MAYQCQFGTGGKMSWNGGCSSFILFGLAFLWDYFTIYI